MQPQTPKPFRWLRFLLAGGCTLLWVYTPVFGFTPAQCVGRYEAVEGMTAARGFGEALKAFDRERLTWTSRGVEPEHLPFVLHHGSKQGGVVVLIHGISETPAGMRFLAEEYHRAGFNVVTVLLSGHGTTPEALNSGRVADWRQQIDQALDQASALGDKVVVAGYSFGATLARDAGVRRQIPAVLHSPMLSPNPLLATEQRQRHAEGKKWTSEKADEKLPGLAGFTYQRTPTQAYVQMLDSAEALQQEWADKPSPPTLVLFGGADKIADPSATRQFIARNALPASQVIEVTGGKHDDLARQTTRELFPRGAFNTMVRQLLP